MFRFDGVLVDFGIYHGTSVQTSGLTGDHSALLFRAVLEPYAISKAAGFSLLFRSPVQKVSEPGFFMGVREAAVGAL